MRSKVAALVVAMLLIIGLSTSVAQAEATLAVSPIEPVTGEQITFDVGTTMSGLEAMISTTGLTYVSHTGLGTQNHVVTVPGVVGSVYTYTVSARPGETVSFVLSDVMESDENGDEREGRTSAWMATAQAAPTPPPTETPTPSEEPSGQPSGEPSASDQPPASPPPSASPSEEPSATSSPSEQPTQPTISGNPSPTIGPGAGTQGGAGTGGGSGTIGGTGGSGGGGSASGTIGGGSQQGVPQTGDLGHFWSLIGIIGVLIVIIVVAGKRVFAED